MARARGKHKDNDRRSDPFGRWISYALPVGVAAVFAAPVFARSSAAAAGALFAASLGAAVLAFTPRVGAVAPFGSRTIRIAAIALLAFLGALALATIRAQSPVIALMGALGQRLGLALWFTCVAWLWLGIRWSDRQGLRRLMLVTAVGPALYGLAAVAERASGTVRTWGSAAGLLENSLTLGSVLVLGLTCSAAVFLTERATWKRGVAIASALACVAGLFVAESRGAVVGIVAAGIVTLGYRLASTPRGRLSLAVGVPAAGAITTGLLGLASSGVFGTGAFSALNTLGNERLIIWRAASDAISRDWIFGRGLEHFTAILSYGYVRERVMGFQSALDPHNALFAIVLGGGVVAAVAVLVAAGALIKAALDGSAAAGSPLFIGVLLGGIVGVGASSLFAWPSPVAFISAAALLGCLIGVSEPSDEKAAPEWVAPAARWGLGVASALIAVMALGPLVSDVRFAALSPEQRFDAARLMPVTAAAPSATMDARAFQSLMAAQPDADVPADLLTRVRGAAEWHVDAAATLVTYELLRADSISGEGWADIRRAADVGRQADGATPFWDYWLATVASGEGMDEEAAAYARAGLEKYPDSQKSAELRRLVDE